MSLLVMCIRQTRKTKQEHRKLNMYQTQAFHRPNTINNRGFPLQQTSTFIEAGLPNNPTSTRNQLSNPFSPKKVYCKLYLPDGAIRYFTMEKPLTWHEFCSKYLIKDNLKISELKVYYEDEEAEWIRISREEEWKELLNNDLIVSQLIKFKIIHGKPQARQPIVPQEPDYLQLLEELVKIGFSVNGSREELLELLKKYKGDLKKVTEVLLASPTTPHGEQLFEVKSVPESGSNCSNKLDQLEAKGLDDKDSNLGPFTENNEISLSTSPNEASSSLQEQIIEPNYLEELNQLDNMCFKDRELNLQLLRQNNGDIIAVASQLLLRRSLSK
jgi:hypothetical protein